MPSGLTGEDGGPERPDHRWVLGEKILNPAHLTPGPKAPRSTTLAGHQPAEAEETELGSSNQDQPMHRTWAPCGAGLHSPQSSSLTLPLGTQRVGRSSDPMLKPPQQASLPPSGHLWQVAHPQVPPPCQRRQQQPSRERRPWDVLGTSWVWEQTSLSPSRSPAHPV